MAGLDLAPLWLTVKLAALTVVLLFVVGLPLAWWLARTSSRWRPLVEAVTALPLVLPPVVLGFYLLLLLGAEGPLGQWWMAFTGRPLAFSFTGLVIASCLYSLPFVVQPLQTAFSQLDRRTVEAAWTLGASRFKTFFTVVLPQARSGVLTAAVLGFAHTLGEFGVALMVGGNIPGETQVVSIAIYEHVEALAYDQANAYALLLLGVSLLVLWLVYGIQRRDQGLR